MQWSPTVVGEGLPQNPREAFVKGEIIKVPMIVGSNLNDGILFGWAIGNGQWILSPEYLAIVEGIFWQTDKLWDILGLYPPVTFGDNRNILSKLITDYLFGCSARKTLRWANNAGVDDTYLYQFTRQPVFCPWPERQSFCCKKVCHGDELPYVFHDSGSPYPWNFTGTDEDVSSLMSTKWASFAKYGNPNMLDQKANWPKYNIKTNISFEFGDHLAPVVNLDVSLCDFWDSVGYYHSSGPKDFVQKANYILEQTRHERFRS